MEDGRATILTEMEDGRHGVDRSRSHEKSIGRIHAGCHEVPDQWLPTLDVKIRIEESNRISYQHYEKPTTTNTMVQKRSSLEENSKVQILANDLVRRLSNTDGRQKKECLCRGH